MGGCDILNVLSLFDGISCGQLAFQRAGVPVNTYYASEVNPCSIAVTQKHFPNTIQLGDVRYINYNKMDKIDILIGGSPCENLTVTVIDRPDIAKGLKGNKSYLFFEYLKALHIIKPKYFLLENVASMSNENKDLISGYLGVEPILIDSSLVSAQDRERLYWTNIPVQDLPKDKRLVLQDIMQENVPEKYYYKQPFDFYGFDKKIMGRLHLNCHDMGKRFYNPKYKSPTLTAVQGGYQEKKVYDNGRVRKLTPVEYERLQTLPDNYTAGFANSKRYSVCGDGWTVDVVAHIFKNII